MYANSMIRRWLPVATLVVLAGWAGLTLAQEKKHTPPQPKDIIEAAKNNSDLRTFCNLLESSGLADTLKGKGPYTVFAPTDAAFKALGKDLDELQKPENKSKLQLVLKNHMLEIQKTASQLADIGWAMTLAGEEIEITVKDGVVTVGKAKVTKADTDAANGFIHVVDTVLMPQEQS